MAYRSTKTYGHEIGLSCCFRQWRADSHCKLLHGYALSVKLEFEADELDHRNWVIDFGGLKYIKEMLQATFDHKMVIARDDPRIDDLTLLEQLGLAEIVVLPSVGCEAFAEHIYFAVFNWLINVAKQGTRVWLTSVEVREHGANSAIYIGEDKRQLIANRELRKNAQSA